MILPQLEALKGALQRVYACGATHSATVAVREIYRQRTVWEGNVEVFVLEGCPNKKLCYAWLDHAEPSRFFSVLENNYIRSAEMAVKSVIFFDLRSQEL